MHSCSLHACSSAQHPLADIQVHVPPHPPHRRSAIPVVVCILSMLIMNKYPSRQEATALVVLTLGVMLAVWQGAVTGKPYAVFFCIAGTVCNGAMMTFSNKLLRCAAGGCFACAVHAIHLAWPLIMSPCFCCSEKLDVVRLTFYTAPVSLACLAPFFLIYEVGWQCC